MPKVRKTFDMAAWESQQRAEREARQRHADWVSGIEKEIRATPTNPASNGAEPLSVKISYPQSQNRWQSLTNVSGTRESVYAYVAWRFSTDRTTQCYEHMALRLYDFQENADGSVVAFLSKSMYAGD